MKKHVLAFLTAAAMAGATSAAFAGDIAAGKAKAVAVCAACHGVNGIGTTDMYPNLAGQKAAYLVKQLKAFRDGTRNDPIMVNMAKPLSDADIDNIAAFYASLK